jgi:hypothetical protein
VDGADSDEDLPTTKRQAPINRFNTQAHLLTRCGRKEKGGGNVCVNEVMGQYVINYCTGIRNLMPVPNGNTSFEHEREKGNSRWWCHTYRKKK